MRSILMIVILALCAIGCSTKDDGGADEQSTTQIKKESTDDTTVKKMSRQEWKRTRLTLHEGYDLVDNQTEPVELHLSDLEFKHAFSIQWRAKGEGHTFWWRGNEYTTNLEEYGVVQEYPGVDKE